MNKVKSETFGKKKSTLMQEALVLALAFTPPRDVSAVPGSGVRGCSYTDFRGVELIDTCW